MNVRPTVIASLGALVVAGVAVHSAPSLIALSAVGRRISPDWAGIGTRGHVALTFDDGPDPASTPAFLEVLGELDLRATFFMLGSMARRAPGLAADVAAAGHEVGVHGDLHRSQLRLSPRAVADDVARGRDAIADATGVEPIWFRPPYGTLSLGGVRAARLAGLRPVLWTAWGRDWRAEATAESVVADVLGGHVDGGTVLLHDSDCTSAPDCWRASLGALPRLTDALRSRSLQVGPLSEHGISSPERRVA
ncbi:MAG: polysaccharide deacetylase family protein [Acidimicrobiia bacterium]